MKLKLYKIPTAKLIVLGEKLRPQEIKGCVVGYTPEMENAVDLTGKPLKRHYPIGSVSTWSGYESEIMNDPIFLYSNSKLFTDKNMECILIQTLNEAFSAYDFKKRGSNFWGHERNYTLITKDNISKIYMENISYGSTLKERTGEIYVHQPNGHSYKKYSPIEKVKLGHGFMG